MADIYYFQSPKNHRRFVFCDQLVFFLAILLEADLKVISYSPIEPDAAAQGSQPCLTAVLFSGDKVNFIVRYEAAGKPSVNVSSLSDLGTPEDGGQPKIVTAQFIQDHYIQIENWLLICAIMNRAKNFSCLDEGEAVGRHLRQFGTVSLDTLLRGESIDEARMLAAIARALQAGTLLCDTTTEPFTHSSALTLRRGVS